MDTNRAIPIGIASYKEIIDNEYCYIDKTPLIRDLLIQKNKVTLFTQPGRFGKTLAQGTLRTFFEEEVTGDGTAVDNSKYFTGKKIMETDRRYASHMGKYPVISLSMKLVKQPDFETAYNRLLMDIVSEFERHSYLPEKDVLLENAFFKRFYDRMVDFIRSLLESALKTTDSLQFAVITGCLRISKKSIFTGLNNLDDVSILDENYAGYFGFTQDEVGNLPSFYGISYHNTEFPKPY